jgi:dihydropteroate synthase
LSDDLNPIERLQDWWNEKVACLVELGINAEQLIFDPGIGFGKTKRQSDFILKNLSAFSKVKSEIMIGHSRKSFQTLYSDRKADQRDLETALITGKMNMAYCQYLRVHDIEAQKIAMRVGT